MAEIEGNEVFICVSDYIDNELARRLSSKVTLIDLRINYYKDDWKSKLHLLRATTLKRRLHKKKLRERLNSIQPDVVISVGQSEKYFINRIKGKWKTLREFHFNSNYRDFRAGSISRKILNRLISWYDLNWNTRGFDHIVLLTRDDKETNGKSGHRKIKKYSVDKIIPQWMALFHSLISH